MQFELNQQQDCIRRDTMEIAKVIELGDLAARDNAFSFSKDAFRQLSRCGLNSWLDNRVGKPGFGATDLTVALEALGEHCEDTGLIFSTAAHLCACIHPIVHCAAPDQKASWLDRIDSEDWLGAHAITEPEAGSDVYAMQTFAQKVEGGFIINGFKTHITNAPIADFIVLHARTSNNGNLFDYTSFIFPSDIEGVQVSSSPKEKLGLRTTAMGDIAFKNVYVPENSVLGKVGAGLPLFSASMEWERTCLFALYVGLMKRQLKQTVSHAEQRQQFGQSIIENQAVGHALVDMYCAYERSRLLLYKAASLIDAGKLDGLASVVSKIEVSKSIIENSKSAVEIHGALGIVAGEIERQYRNAIASSIFSGTTSTLKNNALSKIRKQVKLGW